MMPVHDVLGAHINPYQSPNGSAHRPICPSSHIGLIALVVTHEPGEVEVLHVDS